MRNCGCFIAATVLGGYNYRMDKELSIKIYTDGACSGNPGRGGWAAVVVDGDKRVIHGVEDNTTNNRMEILAAIKGLEITEEGSVVTVYSDSQYVVNTMVKGWKRKANLDLWARLDKISESRNVSWEWVKGHSGDPLNEEADHWAAWSAGTGDSVDKDKILKVIQNLINEELGDVQNFYGIFGFPSPPKNDIRWKKELGGGILNDVTCYPICASRIIFQSEPTVSYTHLTLPTNREV